MILISTQPDQAHTTYWAVIRVVPYAGRLCAFTPQSLIPFSPDIIISLLCNILDSFGLVPFIDNSDSLLRFHLRLNEEATPGNPMKTYISLIFKLFFGFLMFFLVLFFFVSKMCFLSFSTQSLLRFRHCLNEEESDRTAL